MKHQKLNKKKIFNKRYFSKESQFSIKAYKNKILLFISLLILINILILFNFFQTLDLDQVTDFNDNFNFFLISNLNVILLTVLGFLSIRYLVKLIYERRKHNYGFSIEGKLSMVFCIFAILPIILLYFVVQGYLINNLNSWFKGQYIFAFKKSAQIVDHFHQNINSDIRYLAKNIVNNIVISKEDYQDFIKKKVNEYPIHGIVLYDKNLKVIQSYFEDENYHKKWKSLTKINTDARRDLDYELFTQHVENTFFYRNLFKISSHKDIKYAELLKISEHISLKLLSDTMQNLTTLKKIHSYQSPIYTNYETYLLLFIMMVIFGCIWVAMYLSRQITQPLYALVEATEQVGQGYLGMPVNLESENEIGILVNSFNKMTHELKNQQQVLDKKQNELLESNLTLEENNAFIDLVLQNIKSSVLSFDSSGIIKAVNQSMIFNLKLKNKNIVARHYQSILSKELINLIKKLEESLYQTKQNHTQINTKVLIENKLRRLEIELFKLQNFKNKEPVLLLVIHDLTEIDRATRLRAWQEVARRIAHEIKNPLTPIRLSAERIVRKIDGFKNEQVIKECSNTIIDQVNSIKQIVNEFSRFARSPEIETRYININNIIQNFLQMYQTSYSQCQITFEKDNTIPNSMLDEDQMKRVLTNLFDNAIAAMPEKQEIKIKTFLNDYNKIQIEIMDIGEGIPEKLLNTIFEPYMTTKKEGIGLGLAIVSRIISDHDGFISVKNRDDQSGTIFNIELPIA